MVGPGLFVLLVAVISWWAMDGCCYFLVGFGWFFRYFLVGSGRLVLFPSGLSMVAIISWWGVDGSCYFVVGAGWLFLFPGGLSVVF